MRRALPTGPDLAAALAGAGGRPLIVFDGECVLCSGSARFVLRRDRARRFLLTTAQDGAGQALYGALGLPRREFESMLVVEDGVVLSDSDAVLAVAAGLGWPWRLAGLARLVPAPLRDAAYRLVARNRYRWFGRRESCWRPDPADADRVL